TITARRFPMSLPTIDRSSLWERLAAEGTRVIDRALPTCQCAVCVGERLRRAAMEAAAAEVDSHRVLEQWLPYEVATMRAALGGGLVDGRSFVACPLGIIAALRGTTYAALPFADEESPFERWTTRIQTGMTPSANADAARLDRWLVAWLEAHTLELEPTRI